MVRHVNMHKAGAVLWVVGLLSFVPQVIAASRWVPPYSYRSNLISDLGVTTCGIFDEGSRVERFICSPWHGLANAATVGNGVLIVVGALLLWNAWPRHGSGRMAMVLMAIGGVLLVGVGVFPWDTHPNEHALAALLQVLFQWAGMVALLASLRKTAHRRAMAWLTALFLGLSVVGFILFIDAIGGGAAHQFGVGASERMAFDSLTLWAAVIGLMLLRSAGPWRLVLLPAAGEEVTPSPTQTGKLPPWG